MDEYIFVCKTTDVKTNEMKGFKVADEDVLIANVDGKFYAVSAICPHMSGYLGKGTLTGHNLKCPVHGAEFDVKTGKIIKDVPWLVKKLTKSNTNLKTYALKAEKGEIKISIIPSVV